MTLRKYFLLRREHERHEQRWDLRFAVAVRWLLSPNLKPETDIPLHYIYRSLPGPAEEQQELDPAATFAAVSAALGAV